MSAAPEKKPVRRLTTAQKAEAIALWKSGNVTLDDLAKKFKKDRGTFARLFKEEGVEKGSTAAETEKKIQEAVEATLVDDATKNAQRIKDTREDFYRYVDGVGKLTWNIVVKAQRERREPASYATDMKSLEMTMRVLKMVREEKYTLLGYREDSEDDDKPLPELRIQELTAQDIKDLHERSLMADDELGLDKELGDEELIAEGSDDDEDNERVEVDE